MNGKTTYIGIADCHGLESFMKLEDHKESLGFLVLRAQANRHRHALVYQVDLDENQKTFIEAALSSGGYIKACELLHDPDFIENVGIENDMLESWGMIPNPRLDPYSGRFHEEE